jgi:hypothetical protein
VSGDFAIARVDGYLNARLPAQIHFPTGYIGADVDVNANIYAQALLWGKTITTSVCTTRIGTMERKRWPSDRSRMNCGRLPSREIHPLGMCRW